jgi:hypothetical protein
VEAGRFAPISAVICRISDTFPPDDSGPLGLLTRTVKDRNTAPVPSRRPFHPTIGRDGFCRTVRHYGRQKYGRIRH